MSSLSEEEENYVRMSLLLTGVAPRAVRALFDKNFPPLSLPSTLHQQYKALFSLQKMRVINQTQWKLLFPLRPDVAESKNFDVTLMICLIRNLTLVTPPAAGFDCRPSSGEITPGADLARIKYYRNYLVHLKDNKIDNSDFNYAWNQISDAVRRLAGTSMYCECQGLRTKILDQSNHEVMLEMKNCMAKVTDLKTAMKDHDEKINQLKIENATKTKEIEQLKADQEQLKDPVPWNKKEQTTRKIDAWKKDDQMFVDTRAARNVLKCIKTYSCVTVIASSGVGKTFTVRHVALQMAANGYVVLPIINPEDILTFNNPNKKTLYVIDDLCGTYTLNQTIMNRWKRTHEDIKELLHNKTTKIIATCRLQVYQDEQFKSLPLFTVCKCNLLSKDNYLTKTEKQLMAKQYLKSNAAQISEYIDLFDFFPLLCRLYNENQALNVVDFFKNPFSVYEVEIDKLYIEKAYGKYCALALCVMFNNYLKEEWLTEDINQDIQQIIENTCEACRMNRGTSRLVLLDELNSLIHTFLKKQQGSYRTIHGKLFDFLSFYFGRTQILPCFIKYGDSQFISERFLFNRRHDSDHFITIIPDKYHQMYIQRIFDDWCKGLVVFVFANINMKSKLFRDAFLMYVKKSDITLQKQLAAKCDIAANTEDIFVEDRFNKESYSSIMVNKKRMNTPLLHCCALGDINMVEWCCSCGADVNYFSNDGESPLFIACKTGLTDIVTKLVANKADINTCSKFRKSALYIACEKGYTDIVTKLVDNKADINKCTLSEESPLYIACARGFTDIVIKLVEKNANINLCTRDGESPLFIACEEGFTDIVNKLVDNKADINKCTGCEKSPLYVACEGGFTDIVTKLMNNKADINKCTWDGESPLYIACKGGFTDIVVMLVDKKTDINKCTRFGESPLYIACKGGFTDIVTKLVDKKADINKCTDDVESPLSIACKGGFTDIVKVLVDNNADINKCTKLGESPLYTACKRGFTDIATKLVDNNADINKCTKLGESPLYIASMRGFEDIVTKLVDNNADINKCTDDEESPLYRACKGGFTDIVTKLVDNKADVNKCPRFRESPPPKACKRGFINIQNMMVDSKACIYQTRDNGESPLYIACKQGFTDIATTLVNNNADINKGTRFGESPLYIACKGGFTEIVTKLVDSNADINKCTDNGESPLYIAFNGGFTDIVTKLVNKADIRRRKSVGESDKIQLVGACKGRIYRHSV